MSSLPSINKFRRSNYRIFRDNIKRTIHRITYAIELLRLILLVPAILCASNKIISNDYMGSARRFDAGKGSPVLPMRGKKKMKKKPRTNKAHLPW